MGREFQASQVPLKPRIKTMNVFNISLHLFPILINLTIIGINSRVLKESKRIKEGVSVAQI